MIKCHVILFCLLFVLGPILVLTFLASEWYCYKQSRVYIATEAVVVKDYGRSPPTYEYVSPAGRCVQSSKISFGLQFFPPVLRVGEKIIIYVSKDGKRSVRYREFPDLNFHVMAVLILWELLIAYVVVLFSRPNVQCYRVQ